MERLHHKECTFWLSHKETIVLSSIAIGLEPAFRWFFQKRYWKTFLVLGNHHFSKNAVNHGTSLLKTREGRGFEFTQLTRASSAFMRRTRENDKFPFRCLPNFLYKFQKNSSWEHSNNRCAWWITASPLSRAHNLSAQDPSGAFWRTLSIQETPPDHRW